MKQTRNLEDLLRQYDLLAAPAATDCVACISRDSGARYPRKMNTANRTPKMALTDRIRMGHSSV